MNNSRRGVAFLLVLVIVSGGYYTYAGIRWLYHRHHHHKPVATQTAEKP